MFWWLDDSVPRDKGVFLLTLDSPSQKAVETSHN